MIKAIILAITTSFTFAAGAATKKWDVSIADAPDSWQLSRILNCDAALGTGLPEDRAALIAKTGRLAEKLALTVKTSGQDFVEQNIGSSIDVISGQLLTIAKEIFNQTQQPRSTQDLARALDMLQTRLNAALSPRAKRNNQIPGKRDMEMRQFGGEGNIIGEDWSHLGTPQTAPPEEPQSAFGPNRPPEELITQPAPPAPTGVFDLDEMGRGRPWHSRRPPP